MPLMAVAVELLEVCGPSGSGQLHRMKAALAAATSTAGSMGQQASDGASAQASLQDRQTGVEEEAGSSELPADLASEMALASTEEAGTQQPAGAHISAAGGSKAAAASPAYQAGPADARPSGVAIPSFRDVQQAERRAAPTNLFRPSGGAAGTAAQPEAQRPSGAVNPYAFLDGAPGRTALAAAASRFMVPAAAAHPAVGGAAAIGTVPRQPAPAGVAAPTAAVPLTAAGHVAAPSNLAAAAAAALASAAEDSMSEDEGDAGQGAGWLGAVMAAQQRAMGSAPVRRPAVGAAGHAAAAVRQQAAAHESAAAPSAAQQPAPNPADEDGPEVLSLGDSEQPAVRGRLGFMGL